MELPLSRISKTFLESENQVHAEHVPFLIIRSSCLSMSQAVS